jgi:hypothetical protein
MRIVGVQACVAAVVLAGGACGTNGKGSGVGTGGTSDVGATGGAGASSGSGGTRSRTASAVQSSATSCV